MIDLTKASCRECLCSFPIDDLDDGVCADCIEDAEVAERERAALERKTVER